MIAAAPGTIVATRDDVPENTPPNPRPGIGPNDLAGNFVNQDLGDGRFALGRVAGLAADPPAPRRVAARPPGGPDRTVPGHRRRRRVPMSPSTRSHHPATEKRTSPMAVAAATAAE